MEIFLLKSTLSLLCKLNVFLKFLKNITKIKPIQNSKPAKAIMKNDVEINIKSSLMIPFIII